MLVSLPYLAGLFDGEGCVNVTAHRYRNRKYYTKTLVFAQNDRRLCDLFAASLEVGHVYETRPGAYQWRANNSDAKTAARLLLPYLLGKAEKMQKLFDLSDVEWRQEEFNRLPLGNPASKTGRKLGRPPKLGPELPSDYWS